MIATRESLESRIRLLAAASPDPVPLNEPFLKDVVATLSDRLDELALWPSDVAEIDIRCLPPDSQYDGYAGWIVPDPRGPEHPPIGAMFKFDRDKYAPSEGAC